MNSKGCHNATLRDFHPLYQCFVPICDPKSESFQKNKKGSEPNLSGSHWEPNINRIWKMNCDDICDVMACLVNEKRKRSI